MLDIDKIYEETFECYIKAKATLINVEKRYLFENKAISDTVPGYHAEKLDFGSFAEDNFSVLFIDMRNSTKRAQIIGSEKTFLSMHAYIPAMLKVIEYYNGVVIDIMGDGIMVFFGGKKSKLSQNQGIQNSGLCGRDMIKVIKEVVNPILFNDEISYEIDCGVGIDYGKVIVTKIGINEVYDVKAYGECINNAAKFSSEYNKVKVSKYIRHHWPKGKNGKISFQGTDETGYILSN